MAAQNGRPIRLYVRVSNTDEAERAFTKTLVPIDRVLDRITGRVDRRVGQMMNRIGGLGRGFEATVKIVSRLGDGLGRVDGRLASIERRSLNVARTVRAMNLASIAGAARASGASGASGSDPLEARRRERLLRLGLVRPNTTADYRIVDASRGGGGGRGGWRGGAAGDMPDDRRRRRCECSVEIERVHDAIERFHRTVRGMHGASASASAGARASASAAGGASILGGFNRVTGAALRTAAMAYVGERVGRAAVHAVTAPYDAIARATESSRDFERSIMGVAGSMDQARAINEELIRASARLPVTLAELRDVGAEMVRIAPLTSLVAMGTPTEAAAQIKEFSKLVTALASLDEAQGVRGTLVALREGLAGGPDALRSLRLRLEISPDLLASLVGKSRRELTTDPRLLLDALQRYREVYVPDEAVADRARKYSVRLAKIGEQFENSLRRIGESGLYDSIIDRLESVGSAMAQYEQSPAFARRARNISDALGRTLDNLGSGLLKFLARLSGAKDLASTPDAIAGAIEDVAKRIAKWSDDLPAKADALGQSLHEIAAAIGSAVAEIERLRDLARGNLVDAGGNAALSGIDRLANDIKDDARVAAGAAPAGRPGQYFARDYLDEKWLRQDPEERERRRLEALLGQLRAMGFKGGQVSEMVSTSNLPLGMTLKRTLSQFDPKGMPAEQRLLAEQMMRAWEGVDGAATADRERLLALAREKVPRFDQRLRSLAPAAPAAAVEQVFQFPGQIDALLKAIPKDIREIKPESFRAKFLSLQDSVFKVGSIYEEADDRYGYAAAAARSQLREVMGGFKLDPKSLEEPGGDVLDKIRQFRDAWVGKIDQAIGELEKQRLSDPAKVSTYDAQLAQLEGARKPLAAGYDAEYGATVANLKTAVRNFGLGISQQLDGETPAFRAYMLERVVGGRTEVAEAVAERLGIAPGARASELGLASFPTHEQPRLLRSLMESRLEAIEQFGRPLSASLSARQLEALVRGRGTTGLAAEQLAALRDLRPEVRAAYEKRRSAFAGAPTEENFRALSEAAGLVGQLEERLRAAELAVNHLESSMIEFGASSREALENSLGRGIADLIKGTGTLRDALIGFTDDVVNAFSQMASRNLVQSIFGDFLAPQSNGQAGTIGGILGAVLGVGRGPVVRGDVPNTPLPGSTQWVPAAARGGVLGGYPSIQGRAPVVAMARGGIVERATVLVGERGPEAYVPLPGNRKIPVDLRGGGGGGKPTVNNHTIIVSDRAEAAAEASRIRAADPEAIVNVVAKDLMSGGPISRAMRRSPGR